MRPLEEASSAAESVRALNHQTMAGAVLDVAEIYSLLAELSLLTGRLPQLLRQLEHLVDDLVEAGEVKIVGGPNAGDPAAAGAIAGHWPRPRPVPRTSWPAGSTRLSRRSPGLLPPSPDPALPSRPSSPTWRPSPPSSP